jgi:hypothetical protein
MVVLLYFDAYTPASVSDTAAEEGGMSIRVPGEIVIFEEQESGSKRILCWIPASRFAEVADGGENLSRLQKLYPGGVELQLEDEELAQEGIRLPKSTEALEQLFRLMQAAPGASEIRFMPFPLQSPDPGQGQG